MREHDAGQVRYLLVTTPISINIPHQLGVDEAKRRIERGFGELQSQIAAVRIAEVHKAWDGDLMRFGMRWLAKD